jgi:hypothetical protein
VCDHMHDSSSRYDPARKILTLVLVCRICGTERVVDKLAYEPSPVWKTPASGRGPR